MGDLIEQLIVETIPIYTVKRPHPVNLKADCATTTDYKMVKRESMRRELEAVVKKFEQRIQRVDG